MHTDRQMWLFGAGSLRKERLLAYASTLFGVVNVGVSGIRHDWYWVLWPVGILLVFDLVGGVVANGLDTTKRFYHSSLPAPAPMLSRFLHHPVGFAGTHIQPILAGLVFPGGAWWWGTFWYAWALGGSIAVAMVRRRFQRPVALAAVSAAVVAAPLVSGPPGLEWLPAILVLKLVLAHGVPEGQGNGNSPEGEHA